MEAFQTVAQKERKFSRTLPREKFKENRSILEYCLGKGNIPECFPEKAEYCFMARNVAQRKGTTLNVACIEESVPNIAKGKQGPFGISPGEKEAFQNIVLGRR